MRKLRISGLKRLSSPMGAILGVGVFVAFAILGCSHSETAPKSDQPVATNPPSSSASTDQPPNIDSVIRKDDQSATNIPSGTSTLNGGKNSASSEIDKSAILKSPPSNMESNRLFPLDLLQVVTLQVGNKKFPAWVMDTVPKQAEGMMYLTRKDIPKGHAMIFVFTKPQPQSFWMENTYIPLDIAFVAANGKVLNVAEGKPLDETSLPSKGPCQFVIETYKGDGALDGIKAGAIIKIPRLIGGESFTPELNKSGIPSSIGQ